MNNPMHSKLFELSIDMLCVANFDGYLVSVNAAWTAHLGWTADALVSQRYLDFLHPDDIKSTLKAAAGLSQGNTVIKFTNRYRHQDGSYRWLEWNSVADLNEQLIYACVRDITDSKRQADLQKEIEYSHGIGHWEVNLDDNSIAWSKITHKIHGTDPDTFAPSMTTALDFYAPAARPLIDPAVEQLIAHGTPYDLELPFITLDKRHIWVRAVGRAEMRDNKVVGVFGTFQDITDAYHQRQRLQESEQRMRHFFSEAPFAIGLVDTQNKQWIETNQVLQSAYLNTEPHLLTQLPSDVLTLPTHREQIDILIGTVTHPVQLITCANVKQNEVWIVLYDLSEQERTARLKSNFIAAVSHELRTPLTGIQGAVGLIPSLLAQPLPEPQQQVEQLCKIAVNNVKRLQDLITDLLDMEKLLNQDAALHLTKSDIMPIVAQCTETWRPIAESRHIRLQLSCKLAPDLQAFIDRNALQKALGQLLSNAIKFSEPNGQVDIVLTMINQQTWQIQVIDYGIGVPEDFIPHLFEQFTQAQSDANRGYEGTGLGLSIVQALAQAQQGSIDLLSPASPTIFALSLPVQPNVAT